MLARVEQVERGQISVRRSAIQTQGRPSRWTAAHRLMLPERLVGVRATPSEAGDRALAGLRSGVVVLDLVIVAGDHPRGRVMGRLQIGIALVQAVPQPVALQRRRLAGQPVAELVDGAAHR